MKTDSKYTHRMSRIEMIGRQKKTSFWVCLTRPIESAQTREREKCRRRERDYCQRQESGAGWRADKDPKSYDLISFLFPLFIVIFPHTQTEKKSPFKGFPLAYISRLRPEEQFGQTTRTCWSTDFQAHLACKFYTLYVVSCSTWSMGSAFHDTQSH